MENPIQLKQKPSELDIGLAQAIDDEAEFLDVNAIDLPTLTNVSIGMANH